MTISGGSPPTGLIINHFQNFSIVISLIFKIGGNMTKQSFVNAVRARLKSEDIPDDFIDKQCELLDNKISDLPPETAEKYILESNIQVLSDKLIDKYKSESQKNNEPAKQETEAPDSTKTVDIPETVKETPEGTVQVKSAEQSSDVVVVMGNGNTRTKGNALSSVFTINSSIYADNDYPKLLFALILVLAAPIILLVAGVSLGIYVGILAFLAGVILAIVAVVIVVAGAGAFISIAALLYGATQVISEPRYVGIYEIGFGLLVGGIAMFVGIILYNIALRLVPFVYAQLLRFLRFTWRKLKEIFKKSVKGCEKL